MTDHAAALREALALYGARLERFGRPFDGPLADAAHEHLPAVLDELERVKGEVDELCLLRAEDEASFRNTLRRAEAAERERDVLKGAVEAIGRRVHSGDGSRTFDDCIRDLGLVDDLCRAALAAIGRDGL